MQTKQMLLLATAFATMPTKGKPEAKQLKPLMKFRHLHVSKHKVTGKTVKHAQVHIYDLRHHILLSAQADRHGHFSIRSKQSNLGKLKFHLIATKPGYQARVLTHQLKKNKATASEKPAALIENSPALPVKVTARPAHQQPKQQVQDLLTQLRSVAAAEKREILAQRSSRKTIQDHQEILRRLQNTLAQSQLDLTAAEKSGNQSLQRSLKDEVLAARTELSNQIDVFKVDADTLHSLNVALNYFKTQKTVLKERLASLDTNPDTDKVTVARA